MGSGGGGGRGRKKQTTSKISTGSRLKIKIKTATGKSRRKRSAKKRQQPSISKKQTLSMSRTMSPAKTRSTMMTMKTTSPGGHTLDFIEPKTIKTKDSTEMINIKVKMSPISKMLSTAVRQNTKFMMKNKKTKLTTPTMDDQKTISKTMDRKTINITINQQQQPTKMKIIRKKDMIRWIAGMKTPKTSSSSPKTEITW